MKTLVVFFVSILFVSCLGKQEYNLKKDDIITETIVSAIDSILIEPIDSSVLIHFEFYSKRKRDAINYFLEKVTETTTEEKLLASKLATSMKGDTVAYKFDFFEFRGNRVMERMPETEKYYDDKSFFGTVNLIDPVLNSDESLACYYLAINCSSQYPNCSCGSLIYVRRNKNDKWIINRIQFLLQGGQTP